MIPSMNRNNSIDIGRIVASMFVICCHVTIAWKYKYGALGWCTSVAYDCVSSSAVPLFIMFSGAVYKEEVPKKNLKKIIYYVLVYFAASAFYALSDIAWDKKNGTIEVFDMSYFIEKMLAGKYHLWYLPTFACILMVAPIVVKFMDYDAKLYFTKYMLVLWLVSVVLLSSINSLLYACSETAIEFINKLCNFSIFCGNYVGYFILGRFLMRVSVAPQKRKILYFLGGGVSSSRILFDNSI